MQSISLPQNKLIQMAIILLLLSIADAFFTDFGIQNQHISESNPIMRNVYNVNVTGFYLIKIALPVLFIGIVAKLESKPFIRILSRIAIFFYVCVLMLHLFWLSIVFIGR